MKQLLPLFILAVGAVSLATGCADKPSAPSPTLPSGAANPPANTANPSGPANPALGKQAAQMQSEQDAAAEAIKKKRGIGGAAKP